MKRDEEGLSKTQGIKRRKQIEKNTFIKLINIKSESRQKYQT